MRSLHKLMMALLVTSASCARVGAPPPEPPPAPMEPAPVTLTSSLAGVTTLGGMRLRVLLDLVTDDRGSGTGHLQIPDLPLDATGTAAWRGDTLELDLRYDGSCPGDLRIRATRTADGTGVEGTLTAKDCTGEETGTVVLEARTPSARPQERRSALSPRPQASSLPSGNGRL